MKTLDRNTDLGILILRLSLGIMMLLHGVSKLIHGIGPIVGMVESADLPSFFAYGVYVGEFVVPILIVLGVATRASALIFSCNMLVAGILVHAADIFSLNATGGWAIELVGLYFFGALTLVFTGGGKYALSKKHIWD